MREENLLIVADTDHDANMLYAVGMFVPDPFIYLRLNGKSQIVMNDLEIDRARKCAGHCDVLSLSSYAEKLKKTRTKSTLSRVVALILKEHKLKKVYVPANFPLGLARELRNLQIKVKLRKGGFFPRREQKSPEEVKKISAALMMAEVGLAEAIQVLKASKIGKNNRLVYHNNPLTSEKLRSVINVAVLQAGGIAQHTIVAGGAQGCDPHEQGHGPLKANQPIVIDVFPRSHQTGYFGDITRTVVKGRATEALRKTYHTVLRGQEIAFGEIATGKRAADVHQAVNSYFEREGYKTERRKGRMMGFFHGTGHGVGLEIHEAPRIGPTSRDLLKEGHVVTVEPGLYYENLGGVRLEDIAYVTNGSCRNLTKFEKILEL